MQLFDGKYHAEKIDTYLRHKILATPVTDALLIVLIGDNPASIKYTNIKTKICEKLGIPVRLEHISENLPDEEIFTRVKDLFNDPNVSGGIIQLPLPRVSLNEIIDLIPPHKDVDIISGTKVKQYYSGDFSYLPPVVRAFNYFFLTCTFGEAANVEDYLDISYSTSKIREIAKNYSFYIIGQGLLVGKPLAYFLNTVGGSINIDQNYTKGKKIYSDFLILGAGVPNLVAGEDISKNCNVIDFGTGVLDDKVVGDLDRNSKLEHLNIVSLSPGGIGPVVVRFLLANFCVNIALSLN